MKVLFWSTWWVCLTGTCFNVNDQWVSCFLLRYGSWPKVKVDWMMYVWLSVDLHLCQSWLSEPLVSLIGTCFQVNLFWYGMHGASLNKGLVSRCKFIDINVPILSDIKQLPRTYSVLWAGINVKVPCMECVLLCMGILPSRYKFIEWVVWLVVQ